MTDPTAAIVAERELTYGQFINNALLAQALKNAMHRAEGWSKLRPDARESLDMIASKISRIVSGGEREHLDNWEDCCGYSRLVADRIRKGE